MKRILYAALAATLLISPALAATATKTAAPAAPAAAPVSGMLIVHHKVADYAKWRPVFDADKASQEATGLTNPHVWCGKDANDVWITFDMADEAKAKAMASSKELRATMKKAGVMGKPDFTYLTPEK